MSLPPITEKAFQGQVLELADLYGWTSFHTWISIRSAPGWPDLVLLRPPRLIFAELKGERGKVTVAQQEWLTALESCPGHEVYVWRPSDWLTITQVLAQTA